MVPHRSVLGTRQVTASAYAYWANFGIGSSATCVHRGSGQEMALTLLHLDRDKAVVKWQELSRRGVPRISTEWLRQTIEATNRTSTLQLETMEGENAVSFADTDNLPHPSVAVPKAISAQLTKWCSAGRPSRGRKGDWKSRSPTDVRSRIPRQRAAHALACVAKVFNAGFATRSSASCWNKEAA
jgi:hypothetical protein